MAEKLSVEVALEGGDEVQRDLTQLEQSFQNAGVAVRQFAQSFARFSIEAGAAAIVASAAALLKFTNSVENTSTALTELQKVSGASFENLSALQQVFAAGGTTLNKFAASFGNLSEKIAEAGQTKAIRNADKDSVQWANDIATVAKRFDDLNLAFGPLTNLNTKVEGLLESLKKVSGAEEQWLRLADIFKNLSSDLERAQIGKKLGFTPEEIATLSQGRAAIEATAAEAQRLGLTLTTSNQQALQQMAQGWNQFTELLSAGFQKIAAAAAPAFANILDIAKTALASIVANFQNLPLDQAIANLGARLAPVFSALSNFLSPILIQIGTALGQAIVDGIIKGLENAGRRIVDNLWSDIQNNWEILKENLRRLLANLGFGGGGGGGGGGLPMASGGMVGGRGTGTSDSNLAWLSRGEHVMPARVVAQPGVLNLLEALRRGGGNLSRVLDGMDHFALGGMVMPRAIPAFASGGLNRGGSSRVLNLTIEGRSFGGLSIPENTAQALERFAVHSQIASAGKKPSWKR